MCWRTLIECVQFIPWTLDKMRDTAWTLEMSCSSSRPFIFVSFCGPFTLKPFVEQRRLNCLCLIHIKELQKRVSLSKTHTDWFDNIKWTLQQQQNLTKHPHTYFAYYLFNTLNVFELQQFFEANKTPHLYIDNVQQIQMQFYVYMCECECLRHFVFLMAHCA